MSCVRRVAWAAASKFDVGRLGDQSMQLEQDARDMAGWLAGGVSRFDARTKHNTNTAHGGLQCVVGRRIFFSLSWLDRVPGRCRAFWRVCGSLRKGSQTLGVLHCAVQRRLFLAWSRSTPAPLAHQVCRLPHRLIRLHSILLFCPSSRSRLSIWQPAAATPHTQNTPLGPFDHSTHHRS